MPWIVATVALVLSVVIARVWMSWLTAARLDQPISVAGAFHFERPVTLRVSDRYFLELCFDRRDATFETLRSLVGGTYGQKLEIGGRLLDAGEPPGLPIPLQWSLQNSAGDIVASGRSDVLGANSWSAAEVGRVLYQGDLDAGHYIFLSELTNGIPEFLGIRSHLRLEVSPKHTHSRLMATYWWATMFIPIALLVSIATAIAGLWTWAK